MELIDVNCGDGSNGDDEFGGVVGTAQRVAGAFAMAVADALSKLLRFIMDIIISVSG